MAECEPALCPSWTVPSGSSGDDTAKGPPLIGKGHIWRARDRDRHRPFYASKPWCHRPFSDVAGGDMVNKRSQSFVNSSGTFFPQLWCFHSVLWQCSSVCLKGHNWHHQHPLRGDILTCEAAGQKMLESGKIFRDSWSSTHIFSSFSTVFCCWPCLKQDPGLAGPWRHKCCAITLRGLIHNQLLD